MIRLWTKASRCALSDFGAYFDSSFFWTYFPSLCRLPTGQFKKFPTALYKYQQIYILTYINVYAYVRTCWVTSVKRSAFVNVAFGRDFNDEFLPLWIGCFRCFWPPGGSRSDFSASNKSRSPTVRCCMERLPGRFGVCSFEALRIQCGMTDLLNVCLADWLAGLLPDRLMISWLACWLAAWMTDFD